MTQILLNKLNDGTFEVVVEGGKWGNIQSQMAVCHREDYAAIIAQLLAKWVEADEPTEYEIVRKP